MAESGLNTDIVNSKYVVFLGAGASAPLGMMPTAPFLDMLPGELKPVFDRRIGKEFLAKDVEDAMNGLFQSSAIRAGLSQADAELVLDYVGDMVRTCDDLQTLPKLFRELATTGGDREFHERWAGMFQMLRDSIRHVVVNHYSRVDGGEAWKLYERLLASLCGAGQILPVFTTNYDWTFENLAEVQRDAIRLVDGFENTPSLGSVWSRDAFANLEPDKGRGNLVLVKLHGSTSWYHNPASPEQIMKFASPAMRLGETDVVLIYPTQVKSSEIEADPFRTAYEYLLETLKHAHLCVVIGYSFRDPAVNDRLREALAKNDDLKLLVVEPKITKSPRVVPGEIGLRGLAQNLV